MKGRFITLEGGEGAGKSTLLPCLQEVLQNAGIESLVTREPGGTDLGEGIRALLLDNNHSAMTANAEILLIFAARVQHMREIIAPALERGTWVLCDRFTDATYAYQGYGRGIDLDRIAWLEAWLQGELRPDLTLLLDVPVEVGLARAIGDDVPDRFESEQRAFFERVRSGYLARAEREPDRYRVLDAACSPAEMREQVQQALADYVKAVDTHK